MTSAQKLNFITNYRQAVSDLIRAADKLTNLRAAYDALDLSNVLTDADFVGEHEGLGKADLENAVAVINNILDGVSGAPKTAVYKMRS